MRTVRVKSRSFLYLLASSAGFDSYDSQDICTFTFYVSIGALRIFFLAAMGVAVLLPPVDAVVWVLAGKPSGLPDLAGPLLIEAIVWAVLFAVWTVVRITKRATVIGEMYDSWKNKHCVEVEVVE